jgi:transcriptional/translational regulatory protein YebC/TACO1
MFAASSIIRINRLLFKVGRPVSTSPLLTSAWRASVVVPSQFAVGCVNRSNAPAIMNTRRWMAVTGRKSKNVQGKKNKLDMQKKKLYARLGSRIIMAAKTGGMDPTQNIELARALQVAKEVKLPKENIDRALAKAGDNTSDNIVHRVYEVFGHGGVGILVSALSDNTNRIFKEVKAVVRRNEGAKMAAEGSVKFKFSEKVWRGIICTA